MNVTTIDAVTFGVSDIGVAKRFWTDFGLTLLADSSRRLVFSSLDGSTVEVRSADDPTLPPKFEAGDGVREATWGVRSQDDLNAIMAELSRDRKVTVDSEGTLHTLDPLGIGVAFRVSRC